MEFAQFRCEAVLNIHYTRFTSIPRSRNEAMLLSVARESVMSKLISEMGHTNAGVTHPTFAESATTTRNLACCTIARKVKLSSGSMTVTPRVTSIPQTLTKTLSM